MDYSNQYTDRRNSIIALFKDSFAASEGPAEGDMVGNLVTTTFA